METKESPPAPKDLEGQVAVTGQMIINQLRALVTPAKGKKGNWMAKLSDGNLAEVYHRLRMSQSPQKIAQIAITDWGAGGTGATAKSLARAIREFREKALSQLQLAKQDAKTPEEKEEVKNQGKRGKRILESLDGLATYRWLINVQAERVELLFTKEKGALPFKFTDKSIEVLGNLLEKYNRLMMDLGVLDSKPSEFNLNVKHQFDGMMENMVQGGGVAITQALNNFMDKVEQETMTLTINDDGTYALKDKHGD